MLFVLNAWQGSLTRGRAYVRVNRLKMIRVTILIILLLTPAICLLTPELCPEDLQGMRQMLAVVEDGCAGQGVSSLRLAEQRQHPDDSNIPPEDECFCCCHHVVPQLIFVSPDQVTSVKLILEAVGDSASPTGDPPYHPPRFS